MTIGSDIVRDVIDPLFAGTLVEGVTRSVTVNLKTQTVDPATGELTGAADTLVVQDGIVFEFTSQEILASNGKINDSDRKCQIQATTALADITLKDTVTIGTKIYGIESFKEFDVLDELQEFWILQLRER